MSSALINLAKNRRTIYKLGKESPVPDSKIEELVNAAILHVPSSFNTQSTRLVVLLHGQHDRLWDIAIEAFEGLVKAGKISQEIWEKQTLPKLLGFKGAYGTVRSFVFPFPFGFGFISLELEVSSPVRS
jgi:predicted oxidoreductase (fatty acid repression mutant protein)